MNTLIPPPQLLRQTAGSWRKFQIIGALLVSTDNSGKITVSIADGVNLLQHPPEKRFVQSSLVRQF